MRVDIPSNIAELREALRRNNNSSSSAYSNKSPLRVDLPQGECRFIAGGTDLLLQLRESPRLAPDLIDLSGVTELKGFASHGEILEIGACATFSEIEKHPVIRETSFALARAASLVGSPQIRNLGTIGGNLANASPAADSLPPLCALGAELLVEDAEGERVTLRPEQLAASPGKTRLAPDQYIRSILLPIRHNIRSFFVKTGSRKAVAISKLSLALVFSRSPGYVRLFAGSLGASPIRIESAEKLIDRRDWTESNHAAFLDTLTEAVERAIPDRASLPFKRIAVRGLGDDLWTAGKEAFFRG